MATPLRRSAELYAEQLIENLRPIEAFARIFYSAIGGVVVLFALSSAVRGGMADGPSQAFRDLVVTLSVCLAVGAAAASVGCLLGFLFGIPRSLQRPPATLDRQQVVQDPDAAARQDQAKRSFASNTSLEEISDWLTKIIIGIGLVQFNTLMTYLYMASVYAGSLVASKPIAEKIGNLSSYDPGLASPFFFALILTLLICSCLFSYIETRTRLTLLLLGAERNLSGELEGQFASAADRSVAKPDQVAQLRRTAVTPALPTADDEKVARISRAALANTTEVIGWASAQARTGNLAVAEDTLEDALEKEPKNDELQLRLADVLRLKGDYAGALAHTAAVVERTTNPRKRVDLLRRALYGALYLPPPHSFRQAIPLSDQLLAMPTGADVTTYLWRSAALGQKYEWLKEHEGSAEELTQTRQQALEAVRKVVDLNPDYQSATRSLLRSLFHPQEEGAPDGENDLEVFRGDQDFEALIYKDRP